MSKHVDEEYAAKLDKSARTLNQPRESQHDQSLRSYGIMLKRYNNIFSDTTFLRARSFRR